MTNKIVKYKTNYVINFKKELNFDPVIISEDAFDLIEQALKESEFIKIWWVLHNKYNISHIKPYQIDEDITLLLKKESQEVKDEFKKRLWKRDISKISLQWAKNAIKTIKEQIN